MPGADLNGALRVNTAAATTATRTSVAAATADTQILAAGSRLGFILFNESTATLFLALGSAAASATSYSVKVAGGEYYEAPYGFSGPVRGVWDAVNGAARVTEVA